MQWERWAGSEFQCPKDLGGMGLNYLSYVLVVEELARFDESHSISTDPRSSSHMRASARSSGQRR